MNSPKKILVIRNDKIGDFMLAWPAFSLLKKQYPGAEITALVPEYTAPLAEHCTWIDKVLIDTKSDSLLIDIRSLSDKVKPYNYDLSISLFSEMRTSAALWLAGIPKRIGPATKLAQIFINNTLRQKRSQSKKPEYEYNLDLIKYTIKLNGDTLVEDNKPPFLAFDEAETGNLRKTLTTQYSISTDTVIVFVHPGTGGSAINLSVTQYAALAINIAKRKDAYFVITAGPNEHDVANELSAQLQGYRHHVHISENGIIEFSKFIGICDLFISGSTGPLHIAGALNVNTAAFYPEKKSATELRWMTLNAEEKRLAFTMMTQPSDLDTRSAAASIVKKYFK